MSTPNRLPPPPPSDWYPPAPTPWYPPLPAPAPELPTLYLPNLIVAMIASVGLVIGSLGPWMTFLVFDRTDTDGDGAITLMLGLVSAVALFVVFNLGRSQTKTGLMKRLSRLVVGAGVLAFVIGVADAHEVTSRKVELFGQTVGPQIGWGLWLVLITSVVLTVTAGVVVRQVSKMKQMTPVSADGQWGRLS